MIAITAATGHLGKLVINELIKRGTDPKSIIAVVRDKSKASDLASKGVEIRLGDYDSPADLEKAFVGVDKLLLISGKALGLRIAQHTNVVNAAKKAKVKWIAYTSILNADKSKMQLAEEHFGTEKVIQASGVPFVMLRNGWYIENYTEQLANFVQHGAIAGSAQDGKISAATRADYASAAVAALFGKVKPNSIQELGGKAFTLSELAGVVSQASGKKVEYKNMPASAYKQMLLGFGLPEPVAGMLADSDEGIVRGELFTQSKDLENLIGHAPTTIEAVVKSAFK